MTFRPPSSPENRCSSRPRKVVAPLATTALVAAFGAWHSLQAQQTPEAPAHTTESRAPHRSETADSTAPTRGERLAQGDILPRERWPHPPWPRPRPWPQPALQQELRLVSQQARVRVDDAAARTTITQVFENTTGRTIEGTYLFPLPAGAAVSDFAMTVNGKRVEAEILDRDKARGIYEGIVAKMRDPAILEFTDRNLLRARIFPVAAGDRPKVELSYAEALKPESGGDTGSFRYVLPLRLPVGGTAREASVDVEINSRRGLRGVYSPTHKVEVARDAANANRARVSGEFKPSDAPTPASTSTSTSGDTGRADRDFVLYFSTGAARVGVSPVVFESAGEDPYFMLLVAPDPKIDAREVAAKDVVFVCDTSGSMEGDKIVQARKAVRNLVGLLNPADRFNVVTFSSDVRLFRDNLIPASAANIEEARGWADKIKAVGGTNINDSLVEALKMFGDTNGTNAQRARQVVFMTDGQPTVGETDIAQILKNVRDANALSGARSDGADPFKARLFTFGVGYDVNTRLLDTLAEDNRGSSDYVLPEEDIEVKVGGLYRKISFPVLSAPRLDWGGQKVYDVYPRRLPDLFRGTQAVVFGRIDGTFSPTARVQLTGSSGGRESRVAGDPWGGGDARNDALPRLWAARKIGFLIDDARLNDRPIDGEVRDEVIKLSKKYGIVTPLTAALITEDTPGFPRTQIAGGHLDAGGNFNAAGQRRGGWQSAGEAIAGAAPAAPAADMAAKSGAGAVAVSRARREMKEADRVDDARPDVRFVAGKSFFQQNGKWIDTAFDAVRSPKPERIAFGSDAYWKLLREAAKTDPGLPKWLALGDSIVIALRGRTVEIVPAAK